jgi:hypothetical protein
MLLQRKYINISEVLTIAICLLLTHNHQFIFNILTSYQSLTFGISTFGISIWELCTKIYVVTVWVG